MKTKISNTPAPALFYFMETKMFCKSNFQDDVIDGLIDVNNMTGETPEEEYQRACEILKPEKEITIDAYGTKLKVIQFEDEPTAIGDIYLTAKDNASLAGMEEVHISIMRNWEHRENEQVKAVDLFGLKLRLNRHGNKDEVQYHTNSERNSLPQAFETLLKMRDCIEDHRSEKEKLANAKNWER